MYHHKLLRLSKCLVGCHQLKDMSELDSENILFPPPFEVALLPVNGLLQVAHQLINQLPSQSITIVLKQLHNFIKGTCNCIIVNYSCKKNMSHVFVHLFKEPGVS